MRPLSRLDRLGERSRPHYGQLVLWTVLLCSCCLLPLFRVVLGRKARRQTSASTTPASLLSFLPDDRDCSTAASASLAACCSRPAPCCGFCDCCCPGPAGRRPCRSTPSSRSTSRTPARRRTSPTSPAAFLLIYALWYHFYRREIRDADRERPVLGDAAVPALGLFAERLLSRPVLRPVGLQQDRRERPRPGPTACRCNCGRSCSATSPPSSRR